MTTFKKNEILKQIKVIIFDSNIQKEMIDFEVKSNSDNGYIYYSMKFKNSNNYILNGETRQSYIPEYEAETAMKMLTSFVELNKNDKIDISSLGIYWNSDLVNGHNLYAESVILLKENPNILFFPELKLLYFSKKIKLHGDSVASQEIALDFYRENVTQENFTFEANELIKLIESPISDLVTISTVVE